MSTSGSVDVYRNLTRKRWSVRIGGWVAAHVEAIVLVGVTFRVSEASRVRCVRTGVRDVHAWARGRPGTGTRPPPDAVRVRYRPSVEAGFRAPDGTLITAAAAVWFEADGTAWITVEHVP
ncbi:hypothetical protein [Methylobacterium sp. WL6]|uniref:hypothetical protein n=1 Tax=Methylobacterium sp. WL6 TaxID=2603901 RepID=UPI0011CCCAC7|nr:hypothetical protein [Methylobacterium sp. WL6]TXN63218.1 hypothetical protein FV230_20485 [Methylobacterium sp. WL6]